jgi:hypothetical protein
MVGRKQRISTPPLAAWASYEAGSALMKGLNTLGPALLGLLWAEKHTRGPEHIQSKHAKAKAERARARAKRKRKAR